MPLPLADSPVRSGLHSPAEAFGAPRLDISSLLIEHPYSSYVLRVAGPSMQDYGINDGDLMVVDRTIEPRHAHIVVVMVDGEFSVKLLHCIEGRMYLQAGNPTQPDISMLEDEGQEIWGVVTSCIKRFAR